MWIIIQKDDFYGYDFIFDWKGKVKQFSTLEEAKEFAEVMLLHLYQIIEITI